MRIGVPKEIKDHEYRVGLTPAGARLLIEDGHEVHVQSGAGERAGFADALYAAAGATLVPDAAAVYTSPLVIKVKEPQPSEVPLLQPGQILFCYLHLAAMPELADQLLAQGIVGIAFETVQEADGSLPLLTPMSEVAGRLATQAGAQHLQMACGGSGVLLGGVPGVSPGRVTVLGGGTVGVQAARMAMGLGADVTLLDISLPKLRRLDETFGPRLKTLYADPAAVEEQVARSDLVVGAVLVPGKRAPRLIRREILRAMRAGSVLVDVAIDQGGCAETSRPTTHSAPTYVEEGVVHYCVTNMPAAVARTSTQALANATFPFLRLLADQGLSALVGNPTLMSGLNLFRGRVTHPGLAEDLDLPCAIPDHNELV